MLKYSALACIALAGHKTKQQMNDNFFSNMRNAMRSSVLLLSIAMAVSASAPALAQQPTNKFNYTRSTDFTYTSAGRLHTQTVEKDIAALCSTTTFSYDAYGNSTGTTTANCTGASGRAVFATRQVSAGYAAQAARSCPAQPPSTIALQPGAFPTQGSNVLGHQTSATYDARFGVATSAADANCVTTQWQFDEFGRAVQEIRPDGTRTEVSYCYIAAPGRDVTSNSPTCPTPASNEVPAHAIGFVHGEPRSKNNVKNGGFTRTYLNAGGNTIRVVSEAFDGSAQAGGTQRLVVQDTDYGQQGLPLVATEPYFLDTGASVAANSGNTYGMSKTEYDVFGRPKMAYSTDGTGSKSGVIFGGRGSRQAALTQFTYDGLSTTTINDRNFSRIEERNIDGQLIRVTDASNGRIAYQYDAFGNLVKTKDAMQNIITVDFDIRGRKTMLNDPDAGIQKFEYNAIGELVWQQNPNQLSKAQSTSYVLDALGRITSRSEPEFISTWTYDRYADGTPCTTGIGKLCETSSNNGIAQRTFYDALGRPFQSRRKITNGPTFTTSVSYDPDHGRVATKTYPSGLRVSYGYTPRLGYLDSLTNGATTLWRAQSVNAWGKVEQEIAGNGVQTNAVYDPQTGRTMDIGAGPAYAVFRHSYTYDSLSNLKTRNDSNGAGNGRAVTENYIYDRLNRLEHYSISGPDMASPMTRVVELRYNALGSMTFKTDVGTYHYPQPGGSKPHAVTSITGVAPNVYGYDLNGNLNTATAGKYKNIAYTSFNLPDGNLGIEGRDGTRYTWQYDAAHARVKEVRTNVQGTRTTWNVHPDNVGSLGFEQEIGTNGAVSNRHYLSAATGTIGMITTNGAITNPDNPQPTDASAVVVKVAYWHKDDLGSISAITDAAGAVTQRMAYDPFGKRRNVNGSYDGAGTIVIDNPQGTDRGFTGHEEMDDVGIVHMNGRLYDASIGRVMQADPLIQAPYDLQSFDRYSYVMNNPLNLTDPSGHSWLGKYWRKFKDWLKRQDTKVSYNSNSGGSGSGANSGGHGANNGSSNCSNGSGGSGTTGSYSSGCSGIDLSPPPSSSHVTVEVNSSSPSAGHRPPAPAAPASPATDAPGVYSGVPSTSSATAREGTSLFLDAVPLIGTGKSLAQIYTGEDLITGEKLDRRLEGAGIVVGLLPGGKLLFKGRKVVQIADKFCNCCFAAGTPVATEFGSIPIQDVQVGQLVYARDPLTGETVLKPVTHVITTPSKPLYALVTRSAKGTLERTEVTDNHPYWVNGKGWVDSAQLVAGMILQTLDAGELIVVSLAKLDRNEVTYNLTVADFNTFFAGKEKAFVHNCSCLLAANQARDAGKVSGAAAELKVGDRVFTGVSGETVPHHPTVTGALMSTPGSARAPWHGACAEIVCADKALNAGVDPAGGTIRAMNIGISGNGHGTPKALCSSCTDVLKFLGVTVP